MMARRDDHSKKALLNELTNIDKHLERRGTRYLTGETICCFDCELMPRLQHIRVAGAFFCEFQIPEQLSSLWRYMYHMYQLDAFIQSCPADQDIINHYKHHLPQMGAKLKKREELETPSISTNVPDTVFVQ